MVNEFPLTDNQLKTHHHTGLDSIKVNGKDLVGAPRNAISDPTGGATVDAQARNAIIAVITALEDLGLIKK